MVVVAVLVYLSLEKVEAVALHVVAPDFQQMRTQRLMKCHDSLYLLEMKVAKAPLSRNAQPNIP